MLAEVFRALGDPVRLEMVRRLARGREPTIGEVSAGLGIIRQGARKHLRALVDARIALLEPRGREVVVVLAPETLDHAKAFIAELGRRWDARLAALKRFVEEGEPPAP